PEQLEGRAVGPPADVFGLGVVLHELVSGARPFAGKTVLDFERAIRAGRARVSAAGDAPAELDRVLDRALEIDPARRLQDGAAFADALDRLEVAEKAPRSARGPLRALLAGALVAVVLAGVFAQRRRPNAIPIVPDEAVPSRTAAVES